MLAGGGAATISSPIIPPLSHLRSAVRSTSWCYIVDRPRTFIAQVRGTTIALSGFPYERRDVRTRFVELLERTEWRGVSAAIRLLCVHHCVEGATVGPGDYTFTTAADVIRAGDAPANFAAVFSGHIHRHQVLTTDLRGRPLRAPVLYPGSIERTSFAEAGEAKGFMMVNVGESEGQQELRWEFRQLPTRPMMRHDVVASGMDARRLESAIHAIIAGAPRDAVLSIRVTGELTDAHWRILSAEHVRDVAPETMNVDIAPADGFQRTPSVRVTATDAGSPVLL